MLPAAVAAALLSASMIARAERSALRRGQEKRVSPKQRAFVVVFIDFSLSFRRAVMAKYAERLCRGIDDVENWGCSTLPVICATAIGS